MRRTRVIFFALVALFFLGYTGGWWGGRWYFDTGNTYVHVLGGFFIALLVASYYASEFSALPQPLRFFCILAIVMGVGVLWEFHEYALGQLFSIPLQGDLADTMKDLLMDTLGGAAGGLLARFPKV